MSMTREEAKDYIREWCPYDRQEEIIKALDQEPCEDAISRQAVLEYIEGSWAELGHSSENELVCQDIKKLPSVTPQPKMGRWIDDKCSVCGKGIEDLISSREWYRNEEPKLCPFCGARMGKESKE